MYTIPPKIVLLKDRWSIYQPSPVPHWLRGNPKSMNPTLPGFAYVQAQRVYIMSMKPWSRDWKDAQCTLEVGHCLHGVSQNNTELSSAAAAEIRGGLRSCETGCHSHLPQQQTSSCLIGQNCITWQLPAERLAEK